MTVFTGSCYERGVVGHTGKYCPQRDHSTGYNGTRTLCGLRGHEAKVCPKTVAEITVGSAEDIPTESLDRSRVMELTGFDLCGGEKMAKAVTLVPQALFARATGAKIVDDNMWVIASRKNMANAAEIITKLGA